MESEEYSSTKLLSGVFSEPEATNDDSDSPELKSRASSENLDSNSQPEATTEGCQSSEIHSSSCSERKVAVESLSDLESNSSIRCLESSRRTDKPSEESPDDMNKVENKENEASGSANKSASPYDKPVYHELSKINGEINRLRLDQLKSRLKTLRLDTHGKKDVLQRRLKSYYKQLKLGEENIENPADGGSCYYDYYVIIDFEATCDDTNPQKYRHEIIEFPAVLVCTKRRRAVKEFHLYVRPEINPRLTSFCTSLTGITQISKVPYPSWGIKWINIRKSYGNFYNCKRLCLKDMLTTLGMKFEGQPHCGLDDSRNIARVTIKLLKDGANLRVNERIQLRKDGKYNPGDRIVHNISRHNFNGMKKKLIGTNKSDESKCDNGEVGNDILQDAEHEELETDNEHSKLWVDLSNLDDFPKLTSNSHKIIK